MHRVEINISNLYKLLIIAIDDQTDIKEISVTNLPKNWKSIEAYVELQKIRSKWCHSLESLNLKVSSAIISQEYNYIINTKHPLFSTNVKLQSVEIFDWDKRLL